MAKRLICVIISVLMIVSLLPTGAFATEDPGDSTPVASVAEVNETEENLVESEEQETEAVEETVTVAAALTSSPELSGTLTAGTTYTLSENTTVTGGITSSADNVVIDLKGFTLTANITVSAGSLTITDSTATENVAKSGGTVAGDITATNGNLIIEAGNYTGTLTGGKNRATVEFGTFSSKITDAETVIGYADSGYYCCYQNPDGSYTYTDNERAVYVTASGETTYYTTFDCALTAANSIGITATITVLENGAFGGSNGVEISNGIDVVGDLTTTSYRRQSRTATACRRIILWHIRLPSTALTDGRSRLPRISSFTIRRRQCWSEPASILSARNRSLMPSTSSPPATRLSISTGLTIPPRAFIAWENSAPAMTAGRQSMANITAKAPAQMLQESAACPCLPFGIGLIGMSRCE